MAEIADGSSGGIWRSAYDAARRAWPGVELSFQAFLAHATDVGGDARGAVEHPDELFLACACGAGDAKAHAILETQYLTAARAALLRMDQRPEFIDDVMQDLRTKLLLGEIPRIRRYGGRGPLIARGDLQRSPAG